MNWDAPAEGQPMDESMGFIFEDPVTYEIMVRLKPALGTFDSKITIVASNSGKCCDGALWPFI
jgi:hypothetical protein